MQLRPRQKEFVTKCLSALKHKGNTIGIAPTGAGKTIMLSALAKESLGRTLVLQHRDELVSQNRNTFRKVVPDADTDLYTADRKRWSPGTTFAMVQTLARPDNLSTMPAMDLVIIDEAHHVAADSYKKIITRAKELNPKVKLFGVTATPMRGDRKGLIDAFDNVADIISLSELIAGGFLVKPRFFVIDCALREELSKVRVTANDFDMQEVEKIMDKDAVTSRVIEEWKAKAGDRKTVIFCSTVDHARHVMESFMAEGALTNIIHGEMPDGERKRVLRDFDAGKIQILINVAVLTEGWDCQPVSCVVLLRPCIYTSTMIQMIGRGLRRVDPDKYPGVIKSDCIVLDFGYSLLTHKSIDTDSIINPQKADAVGRLCPSCSTLLPGGTIECPICGHVIDRAERMVMDSERGVLTDFTMTEVDLIDASPYRWHDMFDGVVTMSNAITAWAVIVMYRDRWHAVGGGDRRHAKLLCVSGTDSRAICLAAADDYLREYGDVDAARKTKRWLTEPASIKQMQHLGLAGSLPFGITKYTASCQMTWDFNEKSIQRIVMKA